MAGTISTPSSAARRWGRPCEEAAALPHGASHLLAHARQAERRRHRAHRISAQAADATRMVERRRRAGPARGLNLSEPRLGASTIVSTIRRGYEYRRAVIRFPIRTVKSHLRATMRYGIALIPAIMLVFGSACLAEPGLVFTYGGPCDRSGQEG